MYLSWLSAATSLHSLLPYHLTIIRLFCLYTHRRSLHYHKHIAAQQAAGTCEVVGYIQIPPESPAQSLDVVFLTRLVCYPPPQHTHLRVFSLYNVYSEEVMWELHEKHFRFSSYYYSVMCTLCSSTWQQLVLVHPQILGVPSAVHFLKRQQCCMCCFVLKTVLTEMEAVVVQSKVVSGASLQVNYLLFVLHSGFSRS